jgi:hypothetical protein
MAMSDGEVLLQSGTSVSEDFTDWRKWVLKDSTEAKNRRTAGRNFVDALILWNWIYKPAFCTVLGISRDSSVGTGTTRTQFEEAVGYIGHDSLVKSHNASQPKFAPTSHSQADTLLSHI